MLHVSLKVSLLAVLLLPVLAALLGVWRRRWASAPASEVLLASLLTVPLLLVLLVVGLGKLPVHRPLDHLMAVQIGLSTAAAAVALALRAPLGAALRGLAGGAMEVWRTAGPIGRGILLLGLLTQTIALGYGHWLSPWAFDELSYHIPQALQPYQDGRIAPVQTAVVWGDSYPRGAALLYYWTIGLTGTDAGVHPVSATMGFVLMLATFVAGRRLGLSPRWSAIAAGLVPMAPIFFYLSTNGYIDLIAGAMVGAALAFGMPQREGEEGVGVWGWGSCLCCLIALLQAIWMKVTPVPIAGMILGIWGLDRIVRLWLTRTRGTPPPRPGPVGLALAGGFMLALGAIPYLQIWAQYGSPTYPQQLKLGPLELFDGPMIAGSYLGPEFLSLSHGQRYALFWTDWYRWLQIDSPGGLGPLFTLAMLPAAIAGVLGWMRVRQVGWLILGLSFLSILVLPVHFVPRYGIWVLLPGAIFAARLGQALEASTPDGRSLGRSWAAALLALQLCNGYFIHRCYDAAVRWYRSFDLQLRTEHRTRVVLDVQQRDIPEGPTPETRRFVYEQMRNGETLVVATRGHFAMFYDPDFRYRVEHRPARVWGYFWPTPGDPDYAAEEAPAWLEGLRGDGVAMAMVYEGSPEDRVLADPASGFGLVYTQPADDLCPVAIHVYRRSE